MILSIGVSLCLIGAVSDLIEGEPEKIAGDCMFTEGPLWIPGEGLIFSDIPANTIFREDKEVFRHPSGNSNGLTLDREGRLLAAEHGNRRVSRTDADGEITTVAERYEGKRFNSPNDLVVRTDGMIFFTDPPYGLRGGPDGPEAELKFFGVFSVSTAGEVKLLADDFERPNGLALSPDESVLYVADTAKSHIRAFDVAADGTLSNGRHFTDVPGPDGMKVDTAGNVWCTGGGGVHVFSASGEALGVIAFPEGPANCAFGGEDLRTLYVTARTSVYKVRTKIPGIAAGKSK